MLETVFETQEFSCVVDSTCDRLMVGWLNGFVGGVLRKQNMLKGHLLRVMCHQAY